METKKCKYELCNEEFVVTRSDKQYCNRNCKNKAKDRKRYYNDDEYKNKKINSAMSNYENKKKVRWVRPGELTEQELERLKEIRPEWFN